MPNGIRVDSGINTPIHDNGETMADTADEERKLLLKQKRAEYNKKWRDNNKAHALEKQKLWRQNNPDKLAAQQERYRAANKEKIIDRTRKWRLDNPEKAAAMAKNCRLANLEADAARTKKWYHKDKDHACEIAKRYRDANRAYYAKYTRLYGNLRKQAIPIWFEAADIDVLYQKCAELNEKYNLTGRHKLEVDHIIPINSDTVCGLHCHANLQLLDKSSNASKGNTYNTDW